MDIAPGWTLEELVHLVELALDRVARSGRYSGAPNGRVRDIPDQRAIRWYTTTGLVDRPAGGRSRGARYGRRHLLQLVAIKRLQAEGASLAEIQVELAGAGDEALARLAEVPAELLAGQPVAGRREAGYRVAEGRSATRFWAAPAPVSTPVPTPSSTPSVPAPIPASVPPPAAPGRAGSGPGSEPTLARLNGLQLPDGLLLILPPGPAGPTDPSPAELAALTEAARPLLSALRACGLIATQADPEGVHP